MWRVRREENSDGAHATIYMRDMGTEVGGILGFTTLRFLDIKVDYRDGLVWMDY